MNPTSDQISGMADRTISGALIGLLGFSLHKLVLAGVLVDSDVTLLTPMLIILFMAAWGWWVNRPKAIIAAAGAVVGDDGKKTIVVASPELAASTPQTNVVSNLTNNVIDIVTKKALDITPLTK